MNKKIHNVNWNEYIDIFPKRYIEHGNFDDCLNEYIWLKLAKECKNFTSLDIGGGVSGTAHLHNVLIECSSLDPFIDNFPRWVKHRYNWDNITGKFDLIVARGSFNYLTPEQISIIPNLLNNGGTFMFNTFLSPKNGERMFTNTSFNITGTERFTHNIYANTIIYELEPTNEDYIIRHEFFVYSISEIIKMLHPKEMKLKFYGSNSVSIQINY